MSNEHKEVVLALVLKTFQMIQPSSIETTFNGRLSKLDLVVKPKVRTSKMLVITCLTVFFSSISLLFITVAQISTSIW